VLSSLLFGVTALDATTFAATALALVAIAIAASMIPATGAARINPIQALRGE
jgi:ABC-type lipoprotein release transport system permease subunit